MDEFLIPIRDFIAGVFAENERQGHQPAQLWSVTMELNNHRREIDIYWAHAGAVHRYSVPDWHDSPLRSIDARLFQDGMISLWRQEYHRRTGSWEAYVPHPGEHLYAVRERWVNHRPGIDVHRPMQISFTRDPHHAEGEDHAEEVLYRLSHELMRARHYPFTHGPRFVENNVHDAAAEQAQHARQRQIESQRQRVAEALAMAPQHIAAMAPQHIARMGGLGGIFQRRNPPPMPPALRDQFVESIASTAAAFAARWPKHDAAAKRGHDLLLAHLDDTQRDSLKRQHFFELISEKRQHYRIYYGISNNVVRLANGAPVEMMCFQPKGGLCMGDVMLTQKLALELREDDALRVANRTRIG